MKIALGKRISFFLKNVKAIEGSVDGICVVRYGAGV
jgi:hypothetical protein